MAHPETCRYRIPGNEIKDKVWARGPIIGDREYCSAFLKGKVPGVQPSDGSMVVARFKGQEPTPLRKCIHTGGGCPLLTAIQSKPSPITHHLEDEEDVSLESATVARAYAVGALTTASVACKMFGPERVQLDPDVIDGLMRTTGLSEIDLDALADEAMNRKPHPQPHISSQGDSNNAEARDFISHDLISDQDELPHTVQTILEALEFLTLPDHEREQILEELRMINTPPKPDKNYYVDKDGTLIRIVGGMPDGDMLMTTHKLVPSLREDVPDTVITKKRFIDGPVPTDSDHIVRSTRELARMLGPADQTVELVREMGFGSLVDPIPDQHAHKLVLSACRVLLPNSDLRTPLEGLLGKLLPGSRALQVTLTGKVDIRLNSKTICKQLLSAARKSQNVQSMDELGSALNKFGLYLGQFEKNQRQREIVGKSQQACSTADQFGNTDAVDMLEDALAYAAWKRTQCRARRTRDGLGADTFTKTQPTTTQDRTRQAEAVGAMIKQLQSAVWLKNK